MTRTWTIEVGGSARNYKNIKIERKLEKTSPTVFSAVIKYYSGINYFDLVEIKRDGIVEWKGFIESIEIKWGDTERYLKVGGRDTSVILWKKWSENFVNTYEDMKGFFGNVNANELLKFLLRTPKSDFDPDAYPNNKEGWGIDLSRLGEFEAARTSLGDPNYCKLRRRGYGWRNSGNPFAQAQKVVDGEISRVDWEAFGASPYLDVEDDANYIKSTTIKGGTAIYSFEDLTGSVTSVEKVHLTVVWKPDASWWSWIQAECRVYISGDGGSTWNYVGYFGGKGPTWLRPNPWRHFTFDISYYLNTASKVNAAQVKFVNQSDRLSTFITQAYLSIGYTTGGSQETYDWFDVRFETETIMGIYIESRMDDESYARNYEINTVSAETEELTQYSEVDPNGHITIVGTNHIDFDAYQDEDAYLYYDYGVDYFGTYFKHTFDIKVDTVPEGGVSLMAGVWCLSNRLDDLTGLHNSGTDEFIALEIYRGISGIPCFRLWEQDGSSEQGNYTGSLTEGTTYSVTIERIGTALTAIIYAGGTIFAKLSLTLTGGNNYQYCIPAITANSGSAGIHTNIDIEDLTIEKETTLISKSDNIYRDIIHSWTPRQMYHLRIRITSQDLNHSWAISQIYLYKAENIDYRVWKKDNDELGTLYFRDDNHTINGLTALQLGTSQSTTGDGKGYSFSNQKKKSYWGVRIWKRESSGNQIEITSGSPVAIVSREYPSDYNFGNQYPRNSEWINNPANSMIIMGPFTAPHTGTIKTITAYMFVPSTCNCKAVIYDADHNVRLGTSIQRSVNAVSLGQWESFVFTGAGIDVTEGINYYFGICTTATDVWYLYTNVNNSTKNWYRDNDATCSPPNPYAGDDSGSDKPCIYASLYYSVNGIQSNSWNCSETIFESTDAIRIKVYGKFEGSTWTEVYNDPYHGWVSEQMGQNKIIDGIWTFYYYTWYVYPFDGYHTYVQLNWGKSVWNTHVFGKEEEPSFSSNQYIHDVIFNSLYSPAIGPLNVPKSRLLDAVNNVIEVCHSAYIPYEWWLGMDANNTFYMDTQKGDNLSASISFVTGTNLGGTEKIGEVSDTAQRIKVVGRGEGKRAEDISSDWQEDTTEMEDVKTFYEDVISEKSLANKDVADIIANIRLKSESPPKLQLSLEINNDTYDSMAYNVGDTVTVTDSLTGTSGAFKIYNIIKRIDENGEQITMVVNSPLKTDEDEWNKIYRRLKDLELVGVIAADWGGEGTKQKQVSAEKAVSSFFEKTAKNDEDNTKRDIKDPSWYMDPSPTNYTPSQEAGAGEGGSGGTGGPRGAPASYSYSNGIKWTHSDEWMKVQGPSAGNAIQTLLIELRGESGEEIDVYMKRNPKLVCEMKIYEDTGTPVQWYNGDYFDIGIYDGNTDKGFKFKIKALGGAVFQVYAVWNLTGNDSGEEKKLMRNLDRNKKYRFEILTEAENNLVIFNIYDMDETQTYPISAVVMDINPDMMVRPLYMFMKAFDDNGNPNVRATIYIYKFRTEWEKVQ